MKSVKFLLKSDQLRIRQVSFRFLLSKCIHKALMKHARGQNKLFQNESLLMCFCSFATGHFQISNIQSVRHAIELLFKFQINPNHHTSNINESGAFTHKPFFANSGIVSMLTPISNCLPFFFRADGNFYSMILSHTLGRGQNESLIKKSK